MISASVPRPTRSSAFFTPPPSLAGPDLGQRSTPPPTPVPTRSPRLKSPSDVPSSSPRRTGSYLSEVGREDRNRPRLSPQDKTELPRLAPMILRTPQGFGRATFRGRARSQAWSSLRSRLWFTRTRGGPRTQKAPGLGLPVLLGAAGWSGTDARSLSLPQGHTGIPSTRASHGASPPAQASRSPSAPHQELCQKRDLRFSPTTSSRSAILF